MIEYKHKAIPLNQLVESPYNVGHPSRSDIVLGDIPPLAAQIETKGLLQNLVVHPHGTRKGRQLYGVCAGRRRRAALNYLRSQRKIDGAYLVRCIEVKTEDAVSASSMENLGHLKMHPADEFLAFKKMLDAGDSIETVAAAFGIEPIVVQRRLKLANVAEQFIEMFREDKIELDELMALAISDDHEKQVMVWDGLRLPDYASKAHGIRQALTENELKSSHRLVRFVGLPAYEKSGGVVRRDLFSDDETTYVVDVPLLRQLAQAKLERKMENVQKEEAAPWAEARVDFDYAEKKTFGKVPMVRVEPKGKRAKKLTDLRDGLAKAEKALERKPDDEKASDRVADLQEEIEALERGLELQLDPRAADIAGVVLTVDENGSVSIVRGLVRDADKKLLKGLTRTKEDAEVEEGAAKADAAEGEDPKVPFSAALTLSLTAHYTGALRARVSQSPGVALRALVAALVPQVFHLNGSGWGSLVRIAGEKLSLSIFAKDIGESPAEKVFLAQYDLWAKELEGQELFAWLLQQSDDRVLELLAHCAAWSLNTVRREGPSTEALELGRAAGLDMRDYWQPTGPEFLSRVPKTVIQEAVLEGEPDATIPDLKKSDLVAWAEPRLCERRWLPALLRGAVEATVAQ
jgi:ParB family chromosome partitioning protein